MVIAPGELKVTVKGGEMRRKRRTEEEWVEVIGRFRRSGNSARAFFRKEGLTEFAFYKWRKRLDDKIPTESTPRFIEIPTENTAQFKVEISFPNGMSLRIS